MSLAPLVRESAKLLRSTRPTSSRARPFDHSDVDVRLRLTPPAHWKNHDWDTMTALPAVSAIPDIKAARAGVLGLRDVGLPVAPVGVWQKQGY